MIWSNDMSMADTAAPDERPLTIPKSALRYDRGPLLVLLALLPTVAWIWILLDRR